MARAPEEIAPVHKPPLTQSFFSVTVPGGTIHPRKGPKNPSITKEVASEAFALALLVADLVTAMLAAGAAAPAMANDVLQHRQPESVYVLRKQPVEIDGELVWCELWVYDEAKNETVLCIPHDDDDDDHE